MIAQLITHAGEEQVPPNGSIRTERTSTQTYEAGAQRAGRWPRKLDQKVRAHVAARAQCALLKAHGGMTKAALTRDVV